MPKISLMTLLGLFIFINCIAQKPALDTIAIFNWSKVKNGKISDNGKYVSYEIVQRGHILEETNKVLKIQSASGEWMKTFINITAPLYFSLDSRFAVISFSDSLGIIKLGSEQISYITDVANFNIIPGHILYQKRAHPDSLIMQSFTSGNKRYFEDVKNYQYNEGRKCLILNKQVDTSVVLSYYDLENNQVIDFWHGENVNSMIFSNTTGKLAVLGAMGDIKGIWQYSLGSKNNELLVDLHNINIDSSFEISELAKYTPNDTKLILSASSKKENMIQVQQMSGRASVWSYSDVNLKPESEILKMRPTIYQYVFDIKAGSIFPLVVRNEELMDISNTIAIIQQAAGTGNEEEAEWNPFSKRKWYRISLDDGNRKLLTNPFVSCSPHGKYLYYYDSKEESAVVEDIFSGRTVNINESIFINKSDSSIGRNLSYKGFLVTGINWINEDNALIAYTDRDIWLVDPKGVKKAICITNHYGTKNNILFYPIEDLSGKKINDGDKFILMGFNYKNKDNGFYSVKIGSKTNPDKLIMDGYVYYNPREAIENGFDNQPVKAKLATVWLIKRMSDSESPNYFITNNFKTFYSVSSVYPEKKYNWMRTELLSWKPFSGDSLQGVLYKPEDFDSTKKYPVVVHYYNGFSRNLHAYLDPAASIGPINVPWFVSRGYLVFIPDIRYTEGKTGESAYNAIVSAGLYLGKLPFVDSTKIGAQGHSFGGFETNYVITHSNIFAAACESSGIVNMISFSGGINGIGRSTHVMANKGALGLGTSLWDNPQTYIDNSPIFNLHKVTTPVLMMTTTKDILVPFVQALEMFNGLRILRKKVWMLVYDGEDHILEDKSNALDFTIKQTQFFDFYLKGAKQPAWMSFSNE